MNKEGGGGERRNPSPSPFNLFFASLATQASVQEKSFYPFLPYIKKLPLYARCYRAFAWTLEATKCMGGKQISEQVTALNKLNEL